MIEIRLCPKSPEELRLTARFLTTLAEETDGAAAAAPTTRPGRAEAAAPAAPAAAGEDFPATDAGAAGEAGEIPFPPFDAPRPAPSPQAVLDALQDYARANGAVALKALLDRFGARRVSEIKPEHHAAVLALIRGEAAP